MDFKEALDFSAKAEKVWQRELQRNERNELLQNQIPASRQQRPEISSEKIFGSQEFISFKEAQKALPAVYGNEIPLNRLRCLSSRFRKRHVSSSTRRRGVNREEFQYATEVATTWKFDTSR